MSCREEGCYNNYFRDILAPLGLYHRKGGTNLENVPTSFFLYCLFEELINVPQSQLKEIYFERIVPSPIPILYSC